MNISIAALLGEDTSKGDQLNPAEDHIDPLTGESIVDDQLNENVLTDFFLGHDPNALSKIKEKMKGTITKEEKAKALDEIDDLIDNSNRVFTPPTFTKGLITGLIPGLGWASMIGRAVSTKDRKQYREMLYDLRSVVKAAKVKG